MTNPLTKEQLAELWQLANNLNPCPSWVYTLLKSHELADEALDVATAKLATARLCDCVEVVHVYQPGIRERIMKFASACPHCVNGVVYSDERARELLERLKRAEEDALKKSAGLMCSYCASGDEPTWEIFCQGFTHIWKKGNGHNCCSAAPIWTAIRAARAKKGKE